MQSPLRPAVAALILCVSAGGCATPGDFPSLAKRPIESTTDTTSPPAGAPATQAADPALQAQLQALVEKAEAGRAPFELALARAAKSVAAARSSGRESESWVLAQTDISAAERHNAPAQAALAEMDGLMRDAVLASLPANRDAIDQARRQVEVLADSQAARIDALTAALK